MEISEDTNSVITMFVDADQLTFLYSKSMAEITSAQVSTFQSLSKEGELKVTIKNIGTSLCSYVISISKCSSNILPTVEQRIELHQSEESSINFPIRTSTELAASNECTVSLMYSDGEKIKDLLVKFDSKDAFQKAIDGSIDQTGKVQTEGDNSANQCKCGSPFDVICIVLHSCIDYIIGWVAAIVGIIAIPIVFVFMWRCGLFGLLFQSCKCCACCCSLLPKGIMKCLISPYKKKKNRSKKKSKKRTSHSSESSDGESKSKKKKKKKQRRNRYRNSMRMMNDGDHALWTYYNPSSSSFMKTQQMYGKHLKPNPSYEMIENECYEPVARYYK
ncbi:hypothetical protein FDP41_011475 [Naegleria fowleri]|uniref:Generative cell specific-1/HAP2 domain-containing protein n=1 Tax=Naegleria fowleri TaxID=5763 RepID=A0A6A5CAY9_NAEFO|nr:uncharacterized protein FDP41_011475 [Naegleria fowleri]KAF0982545.1 hypothetical protein FDP41_011475 [Naegleria fowleri]